MSKQKLFSIVDQGKPIYAVLVIPVCIFFSSGLSAQSQSSITRETTPTPTEIELENDSTSFQINPQTGVITINATPLDPTACSATADCSNVQVDITTFNAPSAVNQGATINFSWSSRGAWSCAGSGLPGTSWNTGTKQPDGNQSVPSGSLPLGSYTAVLECSNGPVTDQLSRVITIQDGGTIDPNCQDRQPPAGLSRDTTVRQASVLDTGLAQRATTWLEFYRLPFPRGNDSFMKVDRNRYAALSFDTDGFASGDNGTIEFNNPQFINTTGGKLVSISECQGDFNPQPGNENCIQYIGPAGTLQWAINSSNFGRCELQPNTDYYLNVLFTGDDDNFNWACTEAGDPQTEPDCHTLSTAR